MGNLKKRKAAVTQLLALSLSFYSIQTMANGHTDGGTIVHVASTDVGALAFTVKGGIQASPMATCASTGRYAVDAKGPIAPVVLVGFSTGKMLHSVHGKGVCNHISNAEDAEWVAICPFSGC